VNHPENRNLWEVFFDHHAPKYEAEVFTKNTAAEIDFLIAELGLPPGSAILDVGCGTGRHSVGLARRGYRITGVDLSSGMLAQAQKAADDAGVGLTLVHADATKMTFDTKFDAAICLCEGAFGLIGQNEDPLQHDLEILKRIHAALKPGAKLILGALSGTEKIRRCKQDDVRSGRFDPLTLVELFTMEYDTPEGKKSVTLRERGFIASELALMLRISGFEVLNIWGGTAGNWRHGPLDLDEMELMVVAVRKD
jgi:cyclopropane fatty-acyl-phospholipid synthase-like methyltransferase